MAQIPQITEYYGYDSDFSALVSERAQPAGNGNQSRNWKKRYATKQLQSVKQIIVPSLPFSDREFSRSTSVSNFRKSYENTKLKTSYRNFSCYSQNSNRAAQILVSSPQPVMREVSQSQVLLEIQEPVSLMRSNSKISRTGSQNKLSTTDVKKEKFMNKIQKKIKILNDKRIQKCTDFTKLYEKQNCQYFNQNPNFNIKTVKLLNRNIGKHLLDGKNSKDEMFLKSDQKNLAYLSPKNMQRFKMKKAELRKIPHEQNSIKFKSSSTNKNITKEKIGGSRYKQNNSIQRPKPIMISRPKSIQHQRNTSRKQIANLKLQNGNSMRNRASSNRFTDLLKKKLEFDFGFQYPNNYVKEQFIQESARHRQCQQQSPVNDSKSGACSRFQTIVSEKQEQMSQFAQGLEQINQALKEKSYDQYTTHLASIEHPNQINLVFKRESYRPQTHRILQNNSSIIYSQHNNDQYMTHDKRSDSKRIFRIRQKVKVLRQHNVSKQMGSISQRFV